jgi:hypothetical protein
LWRKKIIYFTYIKCIIQVEIIMTIKMTSHKFVNFRLTCLMQILKLMHSLELDDIKSIR